MFGRAVLVQAALFRLVGETVGKGFLHRAGDTFFRSPLVGMVAVVAGFRCESSIEFAVETKQPVVAVLDGDQAGDAFEQVLVFIPLLVQLLLAGCDVIAHLVDGRGQLAQFVRFVDPDLAGVIPPGDESGAVDEGV